MEGLINLLAWCGAGAFCLYLGYKKEDKLGEKKSKILKFIGALIIVYMIVGLLIRIIISLLT